MRKNEKGEERRRDAQKATADRRGAEQHSRSVVHES